MTLALRLALLSDATFGRGDGVAGLVDEEVEHDSATGLPLIRGRTIKGLLVEECANVLFALQLQSAPALGRFQGAALLLFGRPGSSLDDDGLLHVGIAELPEDLRRAVADDVRRGSLHSADVLESLTTIRRQTAVSDETGAPDEGSLRSQRAVLRDTAFAAPLTFARPPSEEARGLLAACVRAFRRGGSGRNRGRGRLAATLWEDGQDTTETWFTHFQQAVGRGQA